MASSSVAVFLCADWRCYWGRRCSSIPARGPPGSQPVLAGHAVDERGAWGGGAAAEPPGEAVTASWGNSSVAVGQVAAGMETETPGFQLGVCLSKISIFWVSAFPHPVTVTQLHLLPTGRAELSSAAGDGGAAQPGCSPGFRSFCHLFMHARHHERVKAHFCRSSKENSPPAKLGCSVGAKAALGAQAWHWHAGGGCWRVFCFCFHCCLLVPGLLQTCCGLESVMLECCRRMFVLTDSTNQGWAPPLFLSQCLCLPPQLEV